MKIIQRLICTVLVLAMLLPSIILTVNASEGGEIVNLYKADRAGSGMASDDVYDSFDEDNAYYTSGMIPVNEGDTITVGPILQTSDWFIKAYDKDGDAVATVTCWDCAWDDEIGNNTVICTYTVPKGTKFIRVTNSYTFYDCTVITQNRPFTADEYFAEMNKAGVNVDFLRPTDIDGELVNLFPARSDDTLRGYVSMGEYPGYNYYYRSRKYTVGVNKELAVGDVIYFAAAYKTHDHFISCVYEDGSAENISAEELLLYEDLKRGYATYVYRVTPETTEVAVNLGTGVYDDGISLVTKNQAFTGDRYREMFGIDLNEDILDESSPLYGLKGLFMGDSISRGSHDYISYTDQSDENSLRVGWAGGISARTGLISTNPSVSGARVSYRGEDLENPGSWVYNQQLPYVTQEFDLVVMHGGVNDASGGRQAIGSPLPVTSTKEELMDAAKATMTGPDGNKSTSYIAGLQLLFHSVKSNFPEATLFFVANYQLASSSKHTLLGEYLEAAREVCEMYGVHYIDLYNNAELNEKLEHDTLNYIEDHVHPNKPGYDIVTPYIQAELERVMASLGYGSATTEPEGDDTTALEPDGSDALTGGTGGEGGSSGCGSVVGGTAALVALALILPAACAVKKKDEE